jgi:hypothetical protein
MIPPDALTAGIRIVRAEEAWEPVVGGGMIPVLGAGAVFWLIRWAIKEPPGHDEDRKEGESEDPPSDGAT